MADATLTAQLRTASGSGAAGRLRKEGLVPAVVYGQGEDSVALTVNARELQHLLSGESGVNTLITLKVDGGEQLALARQIQRHPVKGTYTHVDFIRVHADQTIQAEVPVHLIGEPEGVRNGGHLEQLVHTLTVEALPGDIPTGIEFDVSEFLIMDTVHVRKLPIPAGVIVMQEPDELVGQVSPPRVVEEAAPAEGELAEGEVAEGAAPAAAADGASDSE